ncbi:WD40 repeat-like protein [Suhomyces tanzawaensis NRRL Y-17324]|uniref:Peroxin-7 n=1 Tax=Suhomyces tanzawaensis NRRL Y-17324 TaxID=984487 RepID=A0A1E4SGG9_9ASCO|nr:WD40 repeat-like protein [Suhomyces tanzawaensis NRRL Y-17324]ODV78598.1 WD40 repeat-like protein [Suhomyces tanzawaensis NRRL Y-17324]
MLSFRTRGYNGYAVQYSPYFDNKLAVATAANYGLVGNGRLFVLNIEPNGTISSPISWETQDGLFDIAWSEIHENQLTAASGDGSIKLFDLTVGEFPVMNWKEHTREVFSVNWNLVDKANFVSASWDGTIKIWSPQRAQSLLTLNPGSTDYTTRTSPLQQTAKPPMSHQQQHQGANTAQCIYNASFSPHSPSTLISCDGSSHVQIWDTRQPHPLQIDWVAHGGMETLSCDWNKYKSTIVASAGTDKSVRVWDLRMLTNIDQPQSQAPMPAYHIRGPTPLNQLLGHEFAVRKVQWSPHDSQELLSTSYDMTARVWRDESNDRARFLNMNNGGCKGVMGAHKEFVIGCDYSLWGEPGWAATTGWDEMVHVWDSKRL